MGSIASARQSKATGYGHDTLFSYGQTANGEVIDFTANRVPMKLSRFQSTARPTVKRV